jgi:predicted metal-binding membrane protein
MSDAQPLPRGFARRRRQEAIAAALVGVALAGWLVTAIRMDGMDGGPGTELGRLGWFVGVWVTMMAAMMLPAVVPMAAAFDRVARQRRTAGSPWTFLAGYLVVWTAFGLLAYGVDALVRAVDPGFLAWDAQGPLVVGGLVALAGLYELTPLKRVCLRHCRSPLRFLLGSWRDGAPGAARMGVIHGGWCVGCCWGLMLVLLAVGVMSVRWMLVVAAVILLEKVAPFGERASRWLAVALVALGVWIAAAPSTVPGLHEPDAGGAPMGMPMG